MLPSIPASSRRRAGESARRCRQFLPLAFSLLTVSLVAPPVLSPAVAQEAPVPPVSGALRIFDKAKVYVITNEDISLAEAFLEGCGHKERQILTLEEWRKTPSDIRRFVSTVFLINRQSLAAGVHFPEKCAAERDELYTEAVRTWYRTGVTYEVVISAPDAAWLRRGVAEFRRMKEAPRHSIKRNVRSLAVIPVGQEAMNAAVPLLGDEATKYPAHIMTTTRFVAAQNRLRDTDELYLVDRSVTPDSLFAPTLSEVTAGRSVGTHDTVVWREPKQGGRYRIVYSAPTGALLSEAIRQYPDPLTAPTTATVVSTARDLRSVRRIAVVPVPRGEKVTALSQQLAGRAASDLRALDSFEVLERAGLSAILGEVALGQAGITKAGDRARIRQLAAADALLLVEITGIGGRTEFSANHKRLTNRMGGPPRRPLEPSRLRVTIAIPGKENDPIVRGLTEALLQRPLGTKSSREYRRELDYYNSYTLPRWQRQVDDYNNEYRNRPITWEQTLNANSGVTVTGSLRLVDLQDGLVLWEAPFSATEREERPHDVSNITTYGEDSRPGAADVPEATDEVSDGLLAKAAEAGLADGLRALRGTALLPKPAAVSVGASLAGTPDTTPPPTGGRLLDIDGDILLIGLGATDGLKVGDTLTLTLSDGQTIRAVTTRVRPRTCDAVFEKTTPAGLRTRVTVGMNVNLPGKLPNAAPSPTDAVLMKEKS
jgi:hypothetical protein